MTSRRLYLIVMDKPTIRNAPGKVRDAIFHVLSLTSEPLTVRQIEAGVNSVIGRTPTSSIRSYLRLNTPNSFIRENRGTYQLKLDSVVEGQQHRPATEKWREPVSIGNITLFHADCFGWLECRKENSIHAVVTDPPYGLHEYTPEQQIKLRQRKGGVWRIPPSYDGHMRSPLPRFTTLRSEQLKQLYSFFLMWGRLLLPRLVPGANVIVASNPLLSHIVSAALADAGLERRGEIVRLVMTMRGGDRPKAAHIEFNNVSVMPRAMWEPWVLFRKKIEGRVQDNLRKWRTGGFRRPSNTRPFGDVIPSAPTRSQERNLAPHPSLKPQSFLRQIVYGILPLGEGVILDPFAGAGSTLAAAEAMGLKSIGIEKDAFYFEMAKASIPNLISMRAKSGT